MTKRKDLLRGKKILIVDDEPDVLDTVEMDLETCTVHKARDYETAAGYIDSQTYDVVILDIMGVRGFDLLKKSTARGFSTVMMTAHAITPEALKKSIKLGAISFLPKEDMANLRDFLEEVVLGHENSLWIRLFDHISGYFNRHFGPDWKERDRFFKEFEESLRRSEESGYM